MSRRVHVASLSHVALLQLTASASFAVDYLEEFDGPGPPAGPPGSYWEFLGEIDPSQSSWTDFVPGDGFAHVRVDSDTSNDVDPVNPFQYVAFGPVGPNHRIEARMLGAAVPGLTGFLFTYWEDTTFDEIDIELVADDAGTPPAGHPTSPPDGWTDARFNAWGNSSTTTYLPETSHKQAVVNELGGAISHTDSRFHVYTIDWLADEIRFYIDGTLQDTITFPVADSDSEVLLGFRDLVWAGSFDWSGARTMLVDWLQIQPIDAASPVALIDRYWFEAGQTLVVPVAHSVLKNDQGGSLDVVLVSDVDHGTLSLADDGSFSYIPDPGFAGLDQFVYRADDGTANGKSNATPVWLSGGSCPDRITNGGFETGSLATWNSGNASTAGTTHSGTWSAQLGTGTSGSGRVTQFVGGLAPNTTYRVRAWFASDNEGDAWLRVKDHGGPLVDVYHYSTPAWGQEEIEFTTGPNHTSATVECYAEPYGWLYPTSVVFCDDVELTRLDCCSGPGTSALSISKLGVDGARLEWTPAAGADSYAVTRGDLASVGPDQYGVCEDPAVVGTDYDDLDPLPAGAGASYLIRADDLLCGPGSLGSGQGGVERDNTDPFACP